MFTDWYILREHVLRVHRAKYEPELQMHKWDIEICRLSNSL